MSDRNSLIEGVPQLEARTLFGVLGFAFHLCWVIGVLTNPLLFVGDLGGASILFERALFLVGSLLMLGISLLISNYCQYKNWMKVPFVVLSVCTPLAGVAGCFTDLPHDGILVLWFICGLGTSVLLVLWSSFLSTLGHKSATIYPAISIGIAALLLILNQFLVEIAQVSFVLAFPLISFFFALLERRLRSFNHKINLFSEYGKRKDENKPSLRQLALWRSVLGTLCSSVCLGFALYFMAAVGQMNAVIACSIAVIVACLIRAVDHLRGGRLSTRVSLKYILPYATICLLPLAFIDSSYWLVCICVLMGLVWLNDMISWSEITEHTRINKTTPSLIISFDRFGNLAGIAIGYVAAFITFGEQITAQLAYPFVPSTIVAVLILISVFLFEGYYPYQFVSNQEGKAKKLAPGANSKENPGPWRSKCLAFSGLYRLTPREEEVLLLLAKGRDTSHIEEQLVISNHTVKAHIYNIYKKTEVHSRQELITMIEDFNEEH